MATFSESEKTSLIGILDIDALELDARLDYYASNITDSMKTRALALITEWNTGDTARDAVKIHPNLRNFGSEINPSETRRMIQKELARLVFCSDIVGGFSMNISLGRG